MRYLSKKVLGALVVVSLTGLFLMIMLTAKRGVGMPFDAPIYIFMARSFYAPSFNPGQDGSSIFAMWQHFPPLFPFFLAVIHKLGGVDPVDAARWLNAALLGMNVFLAGLLIRQFTKMTWLVMAGPLWMLVMAEILEVHSAALSEPLLICLTFAWALLLMDFIDGRRLASLLGCSVAAALACMTKFAGIPLVLTGVVVLFLERKRIFPKLPATLMVFVFISLFPMIIWMAKNALESGLPVDRVFSFHPFSVLKFDFTGFSWLINFSNTPAYVRKVFLSLIVVMVFLGWKIWEKRDPLAIEGISKTEMRFIGMATCFIVIYTSLLMMVMMFFDAIATSSRLFLPVKIFGLVYCLFWMHILFSVTRKGLFKILFAIVLLICLIGINLMSAVPWAVKRYHDGLEFDGKAWDKSEIIQEVKKLPPRMRIYTNNFNALYARADRESIQLVPKVDLLSNQDNLEYADMLNRMRIDLSRGNGVIVYCSLMCSGCGLPSIDALRKEMPLKMALKVSDGTIYVWDDQRFSK